MIKASLIPSRLNGPEETEPVAISWKIDPPRFRGTQVTFIFLKWLTTVLWLAVTQRLTRLTYAQRFRRLLEDLGGLWIKVGQLLSYRIDVFSSEFCDELSRLQGQAIGFPPEIARRIIEEELGAPISHFFDSFEDHPFAAASIGQIHRAHLRREKVWVAVKVQRPFLAQIFSRDMAKIEWLVRFLRMISFRPFMRWDVGLHELNRMMEEELDCRHEASAFSRMRKSLRSHGIDVPKIFSQYNRPRILVMELIQAPLMADYIRMSKTNPTRLATWLQENNIDPRSVASRLLQSTFRQIFEDNLYHGDPHPGNVLLLRDSRIALIDFGAISFTELDYLRRFHFFFNALATRDYNKAADIALLLGGSLPVINIEVVKQALAEALRAWGTRAQVRDLPYHDRSFDNIFIEVTRIMSRYRCEGQWPLLRMHRTAATLDRCLVSLSPEIDIYDQILKYVKKSERRGFYRTTEHLLPLSLRGGATITEIADTTFERAVYTGSVLRRQLQAFEGTTSKFDYLFTVFYGQLAVALGVAGLFFAVVFLHQYYPHWLRPLPGTQLANLAQAFPTLDYLAWVLILILTGYLMITAIRLRRPFAQTEVRRPESEASL